MDSFSPATLDAPHQYPGRTLAHLIERSFAPAKGPAHSFQEAFHAFAEAYCTRSLEEKERLQRPAIDALAVDALAHMFSEAVAAGKLARLRFPTRLTASMVLTSLATLQHQVRSGVLAPTEAADLLTTLLFEGLQASPHPAPDHR